MARILICVAWPYANGTIHAGHIAGALLPADIFSRFQRMLGNEVLMVSGSDEHGTPITITAEKLHKTPQEIVDEYHNLNKSAIEKMNIFFDMYSRTSSEAHKRVVKEFILEIYEKGYVYPKLMVSPYCPNCNRFLPDRYVEGTCPYCNNPAARGDQCDNCDNTLDPLDLINPKCKICGTTPIFKETKHLFFKLSQFEKYIKNWLDSKTLWRDNVLNFTRKYLEGGLKDIPITRDIDWGVEVPVKGYENKRVYVWFEAVMGYLSASIAYSDLIKDPDYWKKFWTDSEAKHYYFLGKDNIPFHTIRWPAMLIAHGNLELPYNVPANEYLRFNSERFSKSRGIGFTIPELLANFDAEMLRFYLSLTLPELRDSDFSIPDLVNMVNQELIDKYANFINRTLIFTKNRFEKVPECYDLDEKDIDLLKNIENTANAMKEMVNNVELKKAFKEWLSLVRFANVYFDNSAPWDLYNSDLKKCKTKLHLSLRLARSLAIMSYPYLPVTSQRVWNMLGYDNDISKVAWDESLNDIALLQLKTPALLFKKLEVEEQYDEWEKLDLRVARIVDVTEHPDAERLYIFKVEVGEEYRTLIAGLRKYYTKEELTGRYAIILYNLEHAEIKTVKSEGMLLAADDSEQICLLLPEIKDTGIRVEANTQISDSDKILKHKNFEKLKFEVAKIEKIEENIVTVTGSNQYQIPYTAPKDWLGKYCILFFDKNRPMILHIKGYLVTLDRKIKLGGKVR
jgi:methionyl-tRNA synthetase